MADKHLEKARSLWSELGTELDRKLAQFEAPWGWFVVNKIKLGDSIPATSMIWSPDWTSASSPKPYWSPDGRLNFLPHFTYYHVVRALEATLEGWRVVRAISRDELLNRGRGIVGCMLWSPDWCGDVTDPQPETSIVPISGYRYFIVERVLPKAPEGWETVREVDPDQFYKLHTDTWIWSPDWSVKDLPVSLGSTKLAARRRSNSGCFTFYIVKPVPAVPQAPEGWHITCDTPVQSPDAVHFETMLWSPQWRYSGPQPAGKVSGKNAPYYIIERDLPEAPESEEQGAEDMNKKRWYLTPEERKEFLWLLVDAATFKEISAHLEKHPDDEDRMMVLEKRRSSYWYCWLTTEQAAELPVPTSYEVSMTFCVPHTEHKLEVALGTVRRNLLTSTPTPLQLHRAFELLNDFEYRMQRLRGDDWLRKDS